MVDRCPHGMSPDDGRFDGTWAAPFSRCQCCEVWFPYIDTAMWGMKHSKGKSWTKDKCAGCGGHYVEWENNDE